jgi:hypothetical protein
VGEPFAMNVPATTAFVGVISLAAEALKIVGSSAAPMSIVPPKTNNNHTRTNSKPFDFTFLKQTSAGFGCAVVIPGHVTEISRYANG